MTSPVVVGVDVAKERLDIAVRPSGERWSGVNDEVGIAALVARLRPLQPGLIVCEATGGFERAAIAAIERATGTRFYFATPHHAWERGTNENTNGLIRQYLPKRRSMASLTQQDCDRIAAHLNRWPRKRLGYRTPEECYAR
jgi:IS30 family transposase